ncbi:RNA polymerase sigma factor [Myxococcota bacterium]|nr:RNA polymerase sigma factor [Myxococcota bacterium]
MPEKVNSLRHRVMGGVASEPPDSARESSPESPEKVAPCPRSDQDLIEGILRADESSFDELYLRYFSRVYAYSYRRVRNHADAEEVTQETFVSVFRSVEKFRGQSSLISWIFGIARNLSNNSLRRFQNQREKFSSVSPDHFTPNGSMGSGAPDEELFAQRYVDAIRDQMDELPTWQRRIFEMRHLENMSIPQIANATQRSSDAVRSSLYRVKRMMFETASADRGASHR